MKTLSKFFSLRDVRTSSEADLVDIFIPWLDFLLIPLTYALKNGKPTFGIKSVGS